MSRKCQMSEKKSLVGNRVSHANNKTKVRLLPNLQTKRIWVPSKNRFVKIKVSTSALKSIDKLGIEAYARQQGITL